MAQNQIMGDDPLAWLTADEPVKPVKKAASKTITSKVSKNDKKVKKISQQQRVQQSFVLYVEQEKTFAVRFYQRLFASYPALEAFVNDIPVDGKQEKLVASLALLVGAIDDPYMLNDYLFSLTARHVEYGGDSEHYRQFTDNLLAVLAEFAGKKWTKVLQQAWQDTLDNVVGIMQEAHQHFEVKSTEHTDDNKRQKGTANLVELAFNGEETATLICDNDRMIRFANVAAIELLKQLGCDQVVQQSLNDILPDQQSRLSNRGLQQLQWQDKTIAVKSIPIQHQQKNVAIRMELTDVTAQLQSEAEITKVVMAMAEGDLEKRLESEGFDGITAILANGVNSILERVSLALHDANAVATALVAGDDKPTSEQSYVGTLATLIDTMNTTSDTLSARLTEIDAAATELLNLINTETLSSSDKAEKNALTLLQALQHKLVKHIEQSEPAKQEITAIRAQAVNAEANLNKLTKLLDSSSQSHRAIHEQLSALTLLSFKTNLVALNASVQAIKAGQEGERFNNIADQVRLLAQQTAAVVEQIYQVSDSQMEALSDNSRLLEQSDESLQEIIISAKKVKKTVSVMSTAIATQGKGLSSIIELSNEGSGITESKLGKVKDSIGRVRKSLTGFKSMIGAEGASVVSIKTTKLKSSHD